MTAYDALIAEGAYYAFAARKGFAIAGNNPLTGVPRGKYFNALDRRLGRIAYIAMARECFALARKTRPASRLPN